MTKKFWKDWQNRFGETKKIYGYYYNDHAGGQLISYLPYNIISGHFHGDAVDMVVEIMEERWNRSTRNTCFVIETKNITLHRNEISSIEFK